MVNVRQNNNNSTVNIHIPSSQTLSSNLQMHDNTDYLAAGLAKDWAIRTDAKVENLDYSSKYYAQKSGSYATASATSAALAGNYASSVRQGATEIETATEAGLGSITTATTSGTASIEAFTTASVGSITTAVTTATTAVIGSINDAKTEVLNTISSTGTSYVNQMTTIKEQSTTASNNSHIWAEGTDAQVQALGGTHSSKGWAQENIIPSQTGNADKYLTTNGSALGWGVINLSTKCDTDGSNATFTRVTQTYINGYSWYVLYSNKWCEQGNLVNVNGNAGTYSPTFAKVFANTNYSIQITPVRSDTSAVPVVVPTNKTTGGMSIEANSNTGSFYWTVCGYIS